MEQIQEDSLVDTHEIWEVLADIRLYDEGVKAIEAGEELIPSQVVYALLDGVNPVQVWREHRGLTREDVCKVMGITPIALLQIESGSQPAPDILARLAEVLRVDLDDLIEVNTTE